VLITRRELLSQNSEQGVPATSYFFHCDCLPARRIRQVPIAFDRHTVGISPPT